MRIIRNNFKFLLVPKIAEKTLNVWKRLKSYKANSLFIPNA